MIDDGIPSEWDPEVRAACQRFRQGDLVEQPPFFYAAGPRHAVWSLTRKCADGSLDEDLFELAEDDRPSYGMIVTETCDLTEEDARSPRMPWLTVCPVYNLLGRLTQAQLNNLKGSRIAYMRLLDSPLFPDGVWVVDFRIEIPVEKSWLVGREPIKVYNSEPDYSNLARALAGRRERPVISREVHGKLIKPLRRWIEGLSPPRREAVLRGIIEVRLLLAGSPLNPDGASLLILSDRSPLEADTQGFWDNKWPSWKSRMDDIGVPLLETKYCTLDSCSAREYLDSFQIDLSFAL